jgi:hypothetical protein
MNNFSLISPAGGGDIENMAFSCYAQACEGDFTAGRAKLNSVAEILAYDWVYMKVQPDAIAARYICHRMGVNYDSLLSEEIDYLVAKTEEEIMKYAAV